MKRSALPANSEQHPEIDGRDEQAEHAGRQQHSISDRVTDIDSKVDSDECQNRGDNKALRDSEREGYKISTESRGISGLRHIRPLSTVSGSDACAIHCQCVEPDGSSERIS